MDTNKNNAIIKMVVELTAAKLSNSSVHVAKAGGEHVADFMQEVYEKLVELHNKADD